MTYREPLASSLRRYCAKCGSHNGSMRRPGKGFGEYGEPNMELRLVCPNRRRIFDGHYDSGWWVMVYIPPRPAPPPLPEADPRLMGR